MLYRFSYLWFIASMEILITFDNHVHPNFIDQSKGRLVKYQMKMLGMVQENTVSNHLKGKYLTTIHRSGCG